MILTEYLLQQKFRNWQDIISMIPETAGNLAVDLGCGTGFVANLLSHRFKRVVGIDLNASLLDHARGQYPQCAFLNADLEPFDYGTLGKIDVIFSSFSFAYLRSPVTLLSHLKTTLADNGALVIIEVDRMFSRHLRNDDPFYERIREFETASEGSGRYDFICGSKLPDYCREAGLTIHRFEADVPDQELNFVGPCGDEALASWELRRSRMPGLRQWLGEREFNLFFDHFLRSLSSKEHSCKGAVKMVIAATSAS